MKKKQRILVSVLILSILISGCASPKGKTAPSPTASKPNETESMSQRTFPNKTVLKWTYNDFVDINDDIEFEINKRLDELGKDYIVDYVKLPLDQYESTVNQMIRTENSPDIITTGVGYSGTLQGSYMAYVNDWLLPLEDYLKTENGQKLWKSVPEKCWRASSINGKYLGISANLPTATKYAYYINADLLEKYNIDAKAFENLKPYELEPYLSLVDSDVYVPYYTGTTTRLGLYTDIYKISETYNKNSSFIVYDDIKKEVCNLLESEHALMQIKTMRQYREKNYLDNQDLEQETRKSFFVAHGGINCFNCNDEENTKELLRKRFPGVENIVTVPYEDVRLFTNINSITGVASKSSHMDFALDILTTVMTDRALSDFLIYGIKDVNYHLDDNGKIVSESFNLLWPMYFGNNFITTMSKKTICENVYETYSSIPERPLLGRYIDLSDYGELTDTVNKLAEKYDGLFYGLFENVEDTIEEAKQEFKEAGIDELMEHIKEQL